MADIERPDEQPKVAVVRFDDANVLTILHFPLTGYSILTLEDNETGNTSTKEVSWWIN